MSNNPPTPINTINSEDDFLEQLITHAAKNASDETFKKSDIPDMAKNMARGYKPKLEHLIAQEANKARLDELTRVWSGMNTAGTIRDGGYSARNLNLDDLSYWLHNRRRVLQGEKALTPQEWLEAER